MAAIVYPAGLPSPAASAITKAERRALSDAERPRQARAQQRDRGEFERITWPAMTRDQTEQLLTWWRSTLQFGGAWFTASWPSPRGQVPVVRKLFEQPKWQYVAGSGGMWRLSALCEVRGVGELPNSYAPGGDPFWDDVLLLANLITNADDASSYETPFEAFNSPVFSGGAMQTGGSQHVRWQGSQLRTDSGGVTAECYTLARNLLTAEAHACFRFVPIDGIGFTVINAWTAASTLRSLLSNSNTAGLFAPMEEEVHLSVFVPDPEDGDSMEVWVNGDPVATLNVGSFGGGGGTISWPQFSIDAGDFFHGALLGIDYQVKGMRVTRGRRGRAQGASFTPPTFPLPTFGA